jgi:hypothetical protein
MIGILIFNVLALALAAAVGAGLVPTEQTSSLLNWLHSIIGITPPASDQTRTFALIWIGSLIVIVDGLLLLLVFLTTHIM